MNRQSNRFSDGSFGVWYGSDTLETSAHKSAYHWFRGLLCDAGFEQEEVVIDLKLYSVACNTLLLDFRLIADNYPYLLHKTDYCSEIFWFRMSGEYPQAIVGLFLSSSTDGGNWSVSPGWSLPEYFPPKVE
ncbi:MAG: RES family NAD+ phosphorylase [Chlorobiaceae bacterium]